MSVRTSGLARQNQSCRPLASTTIWAEIDQVYRGLGGVLPACPISPGAWDLEVGGVAVELDEEQHFNRYRAATLESPLYRLAPEFVSKYRGYCQRREPECLRRASNRGYWSSDSTIRQFGPAAPPAILDDAGSPRWKQRAFYDFLKDLAPALVGTPVARLAIWDEVVVGGASVLVKDILDGTMTEGTSALLALIERRSSAHVDV